MKVALTGTEGLTGPLAAALEAEGLEVESCPLVAIEELPGPPLHAEDYDWMLLTSRNAVDALFALYPGPWQIPFQEENVAAARFWRRVAAEVAVDGVDEKRRPVPGKPHIPPDVWLTFVVAPDLS